MINKRWVDKKNNVKKNIDVKIWTCKINKLLSILLFSLSLNNKKFIESSVIQKKDMTFKQTAVAYMKGCARRVMPHRDEPGIDNNTSFIDK